MNDSGQANAANEGVGWCESVFKSSVYLTAWRNPGYCITSTGQHQQIDTVVNKTRIIDVKCCMKCVLRDNLT